MRCFKLDHEKKVLPLIRNELAHYTENEAIKYRKTIDNSESAIEKSFEGLT